MPFLIATICVFLICGPAFGAEDLQIRGYIGETKVEYQYELADGRILLLDHKLRGVKDLRPYKQRHPYINGFRDKCRFMAPILSAGGSLFQILGYFRN